MQKTSRSSVSSANKSCEITEVTVLRGPDSIKIANNGVNGHDHGQGHDEDIGLVDLCESVM